MGWWNGGNVERHLATLAQGSSASGVSSSAQTLDRVEAAVALAKAKDPRAKAALLQGLNDTYSVVVEAAAKALRNGRFDLNANEQAVVAIALCDFGTALKIYRGNPQGSRDFRPLTAILEKWKRQESVDNAITLLATLRDDDCIPALCRGFVNEDFEVRSACVKALKSFGLKGLPALHDALRHADRHVSCEAALVLGELGGSKPIEWLSDAVKRADSDSALMLNAVQALAHIGGEGTVDVLVEVVRRIEGPERTMALRSLGRTGGASVSKALRDVLKEQAVETHERSQADDFVELALARSGDPWAVGPLVSALVQATERDRKTYLEMEKYCPSVGLAEASKDILASLLEKHAKQLDSDDLAASANLADLKYYDTKETDDGRFHRTAEHLIDFSKIRRCAQRELDRRASDAPVTAAAAGPERVTSADRPSTHLLESRSDESKKGRVLSNADIIALTTAGLTASAIIAKVRGTVTAFATDPEDLIALKHAGVDDAVIETMLESGH